MMKPDNSGGLISALAGLTFSLALLVVGVWLSHEISASDKLQDCITSWRADCYQTAAVQ